LRAVRAFPHAVAISARTGAGVEELKNKIVAMLSAYVDRGAFFIPFTEGEYLALLHEKGKVYTEEYRASGVYLEVELPRIWAERLRQFRV
ncbi:MAG: GTPase HflX, partial [Firmicutes bacterium]|nr:GTPase HflX [Bacillota bacterium]